MTAHSARSRASAFELDEEFAEERVDRSPFGGGQGRDEPGLVGHVVGHGCVNDREALFRQYNRGAAPVVGIGAPFDQAALLEPVEPAGHACRREHEHPCEGGASATVVLLHGGLGNSDDLLDATGEPLAGHFRVVAFDRRGHGRTADTEEPFHYDDMATEAVAALDEIVGGPAHLVGWSDGGIVSLLVSLRRPDLVARQVLIGTNYHHDGLRPMEMDPDSPIRAAMRAAYVERSPNGAEHFDVVRDKSIAMFGNEPTLTVSDIRRVSAPTLVMVGDDDIVELGHTVSLYEGLPAGQLAVVPRTSHALPMEAPAELARLVLAFLSADETPQTMMPSRRAHR